VDEIGKCWEWANWWCGWDWQCSRWGWWWDHRESDSNQQRVRSGGKGEILLPAEEVQFLIHNTSSSLRSHHIIFYIANLINISSVTDQFLRDNFFVIGLPILNILTDQYWRLIARFDFTYDPIYVFFLLTEIYVKSSYDCIALLRKADFSEWYFGLKTCTCNLWGRT